MEWRIILPVVCVLGILLVPGSTALDSASTTGATTNATAVTEYNIQIRIEETFKQVYANLSAPETITLKDNITSQIESVYKSFKDFKRYIIRKFSNGSIVTDGALEFNASNSNHNVSELAKALVDAIASKNLTIQIKNDSISVTAPATATPSTSQINVTFSIIDTFTDALSNLSSPEAIKLANNITTEFVTVFKRRYANMLGMVIRKFSKGSIKTDGALEFINNGKVPTAQEVANFIVEATKGGNVTLPIDVTSITAMDSSGVPATPSTSQINVTFSIIDTFTDALSNLSSPEAIKLANNITTEFVTVFKRRYANAFRMVIRKFSKGSIVMDGALEFINNGKVPTAQEVANFIVEATKGGNVTLPIDVTSITAMDSSGVLATPSTSQINVTFSIIDTFTDALSNLSSPEAIKLANNITTEFVTVFKRRYANAFRMVIRKFSKGSIVMDGALEFINNGKVPKAQEVANFIVAEVESGTLKIPIDVTSITAMDSSGVPATPSTSQINVTFSIIDTFTDALSNLSSPEAIKLANNITTEFVTVFKRRYANAFRMVIRKFSKGSIVMDGALEFINNGKVPKAQEVANFIVEATKGGNVTLPIDVTSITAMDSSGVPATPSTSQINVTFSIIDTFTDALSNLSSPEAIKLANNITTEFVTVFKRRYANAFRMVIRNFSKGSIKTDGALEFINNGKVPTAQEVANFIVEATKGGNVTLPIDVTSITAMDSSGVPATPSTSQINVTFSIIDTFTDALSNLSSHEAIKLANNITTEFVTVFKRRYANAFRMVIRNFSKGSIKTDGALEFINNGKVPTAQEVANFIVEATKGGNVTLPIDVTSITAMDSSGVPATPSTSQINVTFSIIDTFTDALSNLSSPEAIKLANNITTEFVTVFKRRYANAFRMVIRKFSKGSIVMDGALEFINNGKVPKAQEVANFIVEATKGGNVTLPIDVTSITAMDSSGVPATPSTSQINVTFSIIDTFTDALSNLSSPEAIKLENNITTEFVTVFKRHYTNAFRMVIRKFSKGSIKTEGALEFINNGKVPKAQEVVNFIAAAVKSGTLKIPIDVTSITAMDSSGVLAIFNGSSPVISSMFTVLWMALASLLLSGVMHP